MESSNNILSGAITLACIMVLVPGVISWLHSRSNKASGRRDVRAHVAVFLIGSIATVCYIAFLWLAIYFDSGTFRENISMVIIILPLVVLGFSLLILYVNYRITYDDEGFEYRNFWRVTRRYDYSEVTGFIEDKFYSKLVVGDKRLTLQSFSVGVNGFILSIEEWRRNNGKNKKIPKSKETLFNDNVYDADNFLAAWVIVLGIMGAMLLATGVASFGSGDVLGMIVVGCIWGCFFLFGLIFKYFVDCAERFPRIVRLLVQPSYIKNPVVREKLGLDRPKKRRK